MALSSILKKTCPECKKIAVEKSFVSLGQTKLITLECGHVITEQALSANNKLEIVSSDGRKLMPYQLDGVKFAEDANARCLIADEQGLGKTVQAAALMKLHLEDLTPAVVVTKTTIKLQWLYEMMRWTGSKRVQAIQSSKEVAIPGFDIIITTYDLLKTPEVFNMVDVKCLVLDECQAIKNHLSGRAKAVQELVKKHNIEHIIGLSGTPIKNNAGEYFTILNLLDPRRFPQYQRYLDQYCDFYNNGWGNKVGGLRDPEKFHQATKDIIIRRTKDEVLKDLPELTRNFYHAELDSRMNKDYANALKELDDLMYNDELDAAEANTAKIVIMTKMRKITGIGKVDTCVDFVTDFLLSSTDKKIVIFAHHAAVVGLLELKLNKWMEEGGFAKVLNLTSSLSGDDRTRLVQQFKDGPSRVMIASTLAAGEGLNLQFCSDAIMLERQWNPANEEQAEARFHRFGQLNAVSITYMIASETIDEYFTELVEQKRAIVASTLDNKSIQWDQNSLLNDLANILVTKGKKKWTL